MGRLRRTVTMMDIVSIAWPEPGPITQMTGRNENARGLSRGRLEGDRLRRQLVSCP